MKKLSIVLALIAPSLSLAIKEIEFRFGETEKVLNIVKKYLPSNPVIIEAGAFDGSDSVAMAKMLPTATIHAFEPVPEIFGWLTKKAHTHTNLYCHNLALSDSCGQATFFVSEERNKPGVPSMSSSLLEPKDHLKYSDTLFKKKINVTTTTLDTWAQQVGIDHVDFLWLDMQGYELNMMKASPAILSTVKVILTEVEFVEAYKGQYLYQDIKDWMDQQGFVLVARNFKIPAKYWFGDALFVKKELIEGKN